MMMNIGVFKSPNSDAVSILFQGKYFTSQNDFITYLKDVKGYSSYMSEFTFNNLRQLTEQQAEEIINSMQVPEKQKNALLFRKPEGFFKKLTSFFTK